MVSKNKKQLYLLDGHSLAHRAFHAMSNTGLRTSEGIPTYAVYGFTSMLIKLIQEEEPDFLAVAFDKKGPTFRHQEFEEYKAHRPKTPDELVEQMKYIREVLEAFRIPIYEIDGYEADDVIGTIARRAKQEGHETTIVTGDKDALQLVSSGVRVYYTRRGTTDIVNYDRKKVKEEYSLEPEQLIDLKGLMGDSSDNIPGIPGIGLKTGIQLLTKFGSLENILNNIDRISGEKRKENLRENADMARKSKHLATIITDVPIRLDFRQCVMDKPDRDKVEKLFKKLEFSTLLKRVFPERVGEIDPEEVQIIDSIEAWKEFCEGFQPREYLAFNLHLKGETPLQSNLMGISLAIKDRKPYYISVSPGDLFGEGGLGEAIILEELKPYLEDETLPKLGFELKEEAVFLLTRGIHLAGLAFDPVLAAYLLRPSEKTPDIETILERELNLKLKEADIDHPENASFVGYLYKLKEKMEARLGQDGLMELMTDIELPLITVLAHMEYQGIKVDRNKLAQLSQELEEKSKKLEERISELAGEEFNLNSPKQLGTILFEKLGLPVIKKTKTGYSTSAEVLEQLKDHHPIIQLILDYRQVSKLKSTYIDALPPLINPKTGRVHTSFNQMVTSTGRLSSANPNLQNIPIRTEEGRKVREFFVPREGSVFLSADYSQVELRVLAHISGDPGLIRAFNRGEDIHNQTASEVFNVEPDEVNREHRRMAKVINFGIAYGMSPYGLARDLGVSREEAEDYIEKYFQRFQGVKEYMEKTIEQARSKGYVTTLMGRRRYIDQIRSRNFHLRSFAERAAINTPIQGSAADIMKKAMLDVFAALQTDYPAAKILLQVHDELVLEVPEEDLHKVAKTVKEKMEGAVKLKVPLIVDLKWGYNWRDTKPLRGEVGA